MTSRSKLVKAMLREVIQGGRKFHHHVDNGALKGSSQSNSLIKSNHGEGSSRFNSTREKRRRVPPANRENRLLKNGSTLKEVVDSLMQRVYQGIDVNSYTYVDVLQVCFKQKDFESVKQVHECIKESGLEENIYVANTLLKCYLRCGRLQHAHELFNNLLNKDIVTWNTMIGGYAENDQAEVAIEVYKQLRDEGGQPDAIIYVTALKACASPVALKWGKDIHAHILHDGCQANIRVSTALLNMYAKCGSIEDARAVFNKMERRDLISWNAMIGGLAQHGHGQEAFSLFQEMQREGFAPNFITYLSILSARADRKDLAWVKEVHSQAKEFGLDQQLSVNNALIHLYAECYSMDNARLVFDNMRNRDIISWNAMIGGFAKHGLGHEAFSLFLQMQREGFTPNSITYVSILNPSLREGNAEWVKEVHTQAMRAGLDVDLRVGNALIHMYARTGSISHARKVFDKMLNRDVVCWNVMIGGLAQHGLGLEAFSLFLQMENEGIKPDSITYASILNPCSSKGASEWVKDVHGHAAKAGLDADLRVSNALIHMYVKIGSIADARNVFDKMLGRDLVTWNVMIGGLAQHGLGHDAFSLFLQMEKEGFTPNAITYVSILNPNSSSGALEWVKDVHAYAIKAGLDVDYRVGNALVHMYAKIGSIADARQVFDNLLDRDVVSWTVMIGGLAQHGHGRVGLELFKKMREYGAYPDGPLFVAVLSACSHAGLVDEGRFQFLSMMRDYDITPALDHCNCMIDILGRAGYLEEAKLFILNLPVQPDIITWKSFLGACKRYNSQKLGELAAGECLKLEPTDPSSYVLLSNIYAGVGSWD